MISDPALRRRLRADRLDLLEELLAKGQEIRQALLIAPAEALDVLVEARQQIIDKLLALDEELDALGGREPLSSVDEPEQIAREQQVHEGLRKQQADLLLCQEQRWEGEIQRLEELRKGRQGLEQYIQDLQNIPIYVDRDA